MYEILIAPRAQRQIKKLPGDQIKQILKDIKSLSNNPKEKGKKLKGLEELFSLRRENFRIIYQVKNDQLIVLVVTLGHRKEVYKRLSRILKK